MGIIIQFSFSGKHYKIFTWFTNLCHKCQCMVMNINMCACINPSKTILYKLPACYLYMQFAMELPRGRLEQLPSDFLVHRFKHNLTTYPNECGTMSNSQLAKWNEANGKKDVHVSANNTITPRNGKSFAETKQGVSLFMFKEARNEDAFTYAHKRIIGEGNVTETMQCYVSNGPCETPRTGYYYDHPIKKDKDIVAYHILLQPLQPDIPVAYLDAVAKCEKPDNSWSLCRYRASGEGQDVIDLPDYSTGNPEAAIALLEHVLSSNEKKFDENIRFNAAYMQFMIALHSDEFVDDEQSIFNYGGLLLAELLQYGRDLLYKLPVPTPYPTMYELLEVAKATVEEAAKKSNFDDPPCDGKQNNSSMHSTSNAPATSWPGNTNQHGQASSYSSSPSPSCSSIPVSFSSTSSISVPSPFHLRSISIPAHTSGWHCLL